MEIKLKEIKNGRCIIIYKNEEYNLPVKYSSSHKNYIDFNNKRISLNVIINNKI